MVSNRIGSEVFAESDITFYGGSFIVGPTGDIVAQVNIHCRPAYAFLSSITHNTYDRLSQRQCRDAISAWDFAIIRSVHVLHAQVGGQGAADGNIHPCPVKEQGVAIAQFDLERIRSQRLGWGLFRDRRPDMYGAIGTGDGRARKP